MYTPADWYWLADDGRLSSSARQAIVTTDDAAYRAWGGQPTRWPEDGEGAQTNAALQDVLTPYGRFVDPLAYANAKQWALAVGGYTITISGTPIQFQTDPVSMGLITGKAARLAQPNPPASFDWQTPTGFVTIAAADFLAAATAIADFVQSTFTALAVVQAAIASGQITTIAGVDAAAWPSNA